MLAAHDRFHTADDRWRALADALAAGQRAGSAADRAADRAFLALLAELPPEPPAGLRAAFLRAAPPGTPEPDLPLADRRDVYRELAARLTPESDRLPPELAYCADLVRTLPADARPAREFHDWVLIRVGETGRGEAARRRDRNRRGAAGRALLPAGH